MMDLFEGSRVRELQAMLFPIQPMPGGTLTSLQALQELHIAQLGRFGSPRREIEQLEPFCLSLSGQKHHQSKDALQALLDARCMIDGITQEAARWPTECQVIPERIRHIEYNPNNPEPFYTSTGKEPRPKPLSDDLGTVIFQYCPTGVTNYFSRSCVGGNAVLPYPVEYNSSCSPKEENNIFFLTESPGTKEDLCFESRFECGNLGKVVKITDTYYQLYLRKDLYTQRHTQWYYFRISNTRSRTTYRLSIVNLCKEESLYNEGLRPLLYSTEDARKRAVGWRRCGDNIAYYRNDSTTDEDKEKHTLTFNVNFPHDRDTVYLAHCYPYTYSDLQEYLGKLVTDPVKTRFTKLRLLCRTLAGNGVYYLTVTAPSYNEEVRRKRGVVITARVHPGETPSSWTMKGIIDFLTGDTNQAKELRERFVFKLVPMLNPDGVIVGNNRCSLSGKDLNRQYRTVMRESYPSVWHTKLMIRRLLEECGIAIYCDLHAHSRKHNIFAYGCESRRTGYYSRLSEQVFPLMLHKNAADKFSFENCKFHVEKGKEGTGRVVVWSMGVQNSYTMEASMGGSKMGSRAGTHFSTQDYEQIGRAFCETLLDFFDEDPTKERLRTKIIARLMKEGSNAEVPMNIDLTDYSSDEGDTSDSSLSDKDDIEYEGHWSCEGGLSSVPPPTPTLVIPRSIELSKRRLKKRLSMGKSYLQRRKFLARRTVMDLPTAEPGSDLNDSTSELAKHIESSVNSERLQQEEIISLADGTVEKEEIEIADDCLILPKIVRPRSVSFAESLMVCEKERKSSKRSPCLRLSRTLRNRSPPVQLKGQDIQIKLSSLRRQIWMGVPLSEEETGGERRPLSWGISNMALSQCKSDDELLKCSSKDLDSLGVLRKMNGKMTKKKNHAKNTSIIQDVLPKSEKPAEDDEVMTTTKKRSRSKWQRAVNLSAKIKDTYNARSSFLTIKADSLKLMSVRTPTNSQSKHQRLEPRRKHWKPSAITSQSQRTAKSSSSKFQLQSQTRLQVQKHSQIRLQPLQTAICRSSSSDDDSNDSRKHKVTKKKQRKKKQQKKVKSTQKKRVSSARRTKNS